MKIIANKNAIIGDIVNIREWVGAKLKSVQQFTSSDLIKSIIKGRIDQVRKLLANGVSPNSVNDFNSTALIISMLNNQKDIFQQLLNSGADPDIKNKAGLTCLDVAQQNNKIEYIKLLEKHRPREKRHNQLMKNLFPYKKGKSTKKAHLEYRSFPRNHDFEHQYYKDTIELLNEEIAEIRSKLRRRDLGGADARTNEILAGMVAKKIPKLEKQSYKPYYSRLDIKLKNGDIQSYYLGSQGMKDQRVYAPQTRIGSLYAQKTVGKVKDKELGEIEVTLIRQIENENGIISRIIDKEWTVETGYVDQILMKRLNNHAKTKMNEIWETIQAEQDSVVRRGISEPIIVQGSAGSGKTVIALHRLSYLLFEYKELEQQKIMILGPNAMYLKYIQEALPHLDVGDIRQTTFENFCVERLPFEESGYSIISFNDVVKRGLPKQEIVISKMKGSLNYQKALKTFLDNQIETFTPIEGIHLSLESEDFSFTIDRVRGLIQQYSEYNTLEVVRNRIIEGIKAEAARFINKVSWKNDKKAVRINKKLNAKLKEFINQWKIPNTFEIYHKFASDSSLLKDYFPTLDCVEDLIEYNKVNMEQFNVTVDDLPALLEIEQWLSGKIGTLDENDSTKISNQKFHYIVIDEAQDYSPYLLSVVNSLVKPGRIMMLGDLGQSIYDFRGIINWKEATGALGLFDKQYSYLELSTIYRSTVQIVKFANELIRPFALNRYTLSEPIGRDGAEPSIQAFKGQKNQVLKITGIIDQLKKNGQKNIAIITRDWEEAASVYIKLKKVNSEINLVTHASTEYTGGTIVIPTYLTKGIEFDAIILTDACMDKYKDDDKHRKLLYVSITRALHHVFVLYNEKLALPLLDVIDKDKADNVREEKKRKALEEQKQRELEEQRQKELEEKKIKELEKHKQNELEEQKQKELEQQRQREVEEQKMHSNEWSGKNSFLKVMEIEFNKVTTAHHQTVVELQERIRKLESELQMHKNNENKQKVKGSHLNDSVISLQKNALFEFAFGSDSTRLKDFFEHLSPWNIDDVVMVQLATLKDMIMKKDYAAISEVVGSIQETIQNKNGTPSKVAFNLFNEIFEDILLATGVDVLNANEIFLNSYALLSCLADSEMREYFSDFLEWNFDYMIEIIFTIKTLPLLVKVIQVYFEYEQDEQVSMLLDRLFSEWQHYEPQLTSKQSVKLLWYSFCFNKDEAYIEKAPYDLLDESVPEMKLYYACYDAFDGDIVIIEEINKLMSKVTAFSPIEKVSIEAKINARIGN